MSRSGSMKAVVLAPGKRGGAQLICTRDSTTAVTYPWQARWLMRDCGCLPSPGIRTGESGGAAGQREALKGTRSVGGVWNVISLTRLDFTLRCNVQASTQ
jgi:hypothetical protein